MIRRADRTPDLAATIGGTIAGLRVVRPLGHSGAGRVCEALAADGTRVALKLFDLAGDGGELAAAFERESAIALQLAHPHIVRTLGVGREGRWAYIAMELVPGGDLVPYTRPTQLLPVADVLQIGARVALALEHAHGIGIVHRDIKPSNILVDPSGGAVKVADFGIARFGDAYRSRTGVVAGTPHYMAPEQLADGEVDARADVYALGVVLFHALTARLPHEATSLGELLRKVAAEPAPPLTALRTDIGEDVARIVAHMLATHVGDRTARAGDVAAELAAAVAARGVATR